VSIYDIQLTTIDGAPSDMGAYRGRLLLVVNVASRCGFTPQYAGLEALYRSHKDKGLVILGFPCNQFGRQEPGDDAQIRRFCADEYGVTFPLFSKINVNGPDTHPLYRYLKSAKKGMLGLERIAWNFTKFLVSREGVVLRRYGSRVKPETIAGDLARWM
jgi:glutathione peroxidase